MTWKRPWIKMWVEMLDDPKYLDLSLAQQAVWVNLLLATTRSPEPGTMLRPTGQAMTPEQLQRIVHATEMPHGEFQATLQHFESMGMVHWNGGALVVTHWHPRQAPRDTTAADRMRRYRQRQGNSSPEEDTTRGVTPPVTAGVTHVTPLQPSQRAPRRGGDKEGERNRGEEGQKSPGAPNVAPGLPTKAAQGEQTTYAPKTEVLEDLGEAAAGKDQTPARVSGAVDEKLPKPAGSKKRGGNPAADAVLECIEKAWGQPIAFWGKEARFVKQALGMGYVAEQILACWRLAQESPRWKGQWMPMASLLGDLGEFVKNGSQPLRKWQWVPGSSRGATREEPLRDPEAVKRAWEEAKRG